MDREMLNIFVDKDRALVVDDHARFLASSSKMLSLS
jgi:hypothetical protein